MTESINELGLVAGRGRYPVLVAEEARRNGVKKLVIAAIRNDADESLAELADELNWVYPGEINKAIKTFTKTGVDNVMFVGQITPQRLFKGLHPDFRAVKLFAALKKKNAETIFGGIAGEFEKDGVHVLPAATFMDDHLSSSGVMGKVKPNKQVQADIEYGRRIATEVSRLDIGQTVCVKNGTVLAVEAFEGTDQAIRRAGEVGHGDVVVVKVPKPEYDPRFDIPCVGMQTVDSLIAAGARAIAVQAGGAVFIDKPEVLAAMDKARIAAVGF